MSASPDSPPGLAARRLWQLTLLVLCAACVAPLWMVEYPPIQDLPQHLAAIRVLHDFERPEFNFTRYFEIDLFRTQYLAYYVAADWLAYLVGVDSGNRLLISASMIGTPLSLGVLLRALGKDERLCVLGFPLVYNAHLILGFLNFLAAIPLSIYGVALAVRQRRHASRARGVLLAALALLCFYTHVVPFALLVLGVALVALQRSALATARALLPLLPSFGAALLWLRKSPAGRATATAATGSDSGPQPQFQSAQRALEELPRWLCDVFAGPRDEWLLEAWAVGLCGLLLLAVVFAAIARHRDRPDRLGLQLGLRLALLSPTCALAYFVMPTSYDWIWPIAQRFPLLSAVWAIVMLPRLPRRVAHVAVLCGALLSLAHVHGAYRAFRAFDREEVGDFDQALAHIPPGSRVVGLIYQRSSRHVAFSPFIHYVAYYQARKGGAVMFTFADFPQSPFRFLETNRPPRVPPRWEWLPARVDPRSDLRWYQYALVRGPPGRIARAGSGFSLRHRGERWSVYQRTDWPP